MKKGITEVVVFILFTLMVFYVGFLFGEGKARYEISEAIRSGRLSVNQRIENVCNQIMTGKYIPVGGK